MENRKTTTDRRKRKDQHYGGETRVIARTELTSGGGETGGENLYCRWNEVDLTMRPGLQEKKILSLVVRT